MRRIVLLSSCLALCFALGACQRLESVRPFEGLGPGELRKQALPFKDAIPAEYGDLVAVTSHAGYPTWAQAWFVRADKSIVVVWINSRSGQVLPDVLTIPRR